jgi:hypothetical protein
VSSFPSACICDNTVYMKRQTVITQKRRGPPPTGKGTLIGVRMLGRPLAELDAWITSQDEAELSRPEAIRRLVELGLAVPRHSDRTRRLGRSLDLGTMAKIEPAPATTGRRSRARELAAEAIDKMSDSAASTEEREERRHRLTKGPPEFQEARVDRPKAKSK